MLSPIKTECQLLILAELIEVSDDATIEKLRYLLYKKIGFTISISCYAFKLHPETGSPARSTIIVDKLTVKLDVQQLSNDGQNGKNLKHDLKKTLFPSDKGTDRVLNLRYE